MGLGKCRVTVRQWMVLEHNGVMWTLLLVPVKTWCLHRDSLTTPGHMKLVLLLLLGPFSALSIMYTLLYLFLNMTTRMIMTIYLFMPLLLPLTSIQMRDYRLPILNLLGLWHLRNKTQIFFVRKLD